MTREELIHDLENILQRYQHGAEENGLYLPDSFGSDMIRLLESVLSREKLLLEKIGKVLRKIKGKYLADSPDISRETAVNHNNRLAEAIDEALAIIEKEGGE